LPSWPGSVSAAIATAAMSRGSDDGESSVAAGAVDRTLAIVVPARPEKGIEGEGNGVRSASGVLLWARPGRDSTTLEKFFDSLGAQRCAQITLVSADAAEWIATVVAARCQNAELCLDPFHMGAAPLE
jgi:Transposase